jgi:dTDP-4-amino-4,6-dideoxygalactose transaminase
MPDTDPMAPIRIPFVKPGQAGGEAEAMREAMAGRVLAGDNAATRAAEAYLRRQIGVAHALLTPSGTAALELAAILADLTLGDEVIMPSYTFSSTANAVVLRGATPVFVDIREDTLNLDEALIRAAITDRTRAIMVVHYAGVPCAMDPIQAIADEYGLLVIEDAAQALLSTYRDRPAGALGDMAAFSFHETKNIHCGEGGAFTCTDAKLGRRAEIVREKGTNRAAFFRGEIDKYTWMDVGSSFLPNELSAAFLKVQLEASHAITEKRRSIWDRYDAALGAGRLGNAVLTPSIPDDCEHNAHIYHLRTASLEQRTTLMATLRTAGIQATSHYVPLHSSPAGKRYGRTDSAMVNTDRAGDCLLRLPLWSDLPMAQVDEVIDVVASAAPR